jgi:hypothetical protein
MHRGMFCEATFISVLWVIFIFIQLLPLAHFELLWEIQLQQYNVQLLSSAERYEKHDARLHFLSFSL